LAEGHIHIGLVEDRLRLAFSQRYAAQTSPGAVPQATVRMAVGHCVLHETLKRSILGEGAIMGITIMGLVGAGLMLLGIFLNGSWLIAGSVLLGSGLIAGSLESRV
jgi:hypothetical protein